MRATTAAFLFLLLLTAGAEAQPYDAVVAGFDGSCSQIGTPPLTPQLEWLGETDTVDTNTTVIAVAPAPGGAIYGLTDDPGDQDVVRVQRDSVTAFASIPATHIAHGLIVDRAGTVYVLVTLPGGNDAIDMFEADGTFRVTQPLGGAGYYSHHSTAPLDLASDQCTLFLVQNRTTIRRVNLCTGTFLADFATLPQIDGVRILPDGGLLVASANQIVRLDTNGVVTRTYTRPGWVDAGPITLANQGTTVWMAEEACTSVTADEIDLALGTLLDSEPLDQSNPNSIVPRRAWTAAIGTEAAVQFAEVPTASTYALMTLIMLVAIAAFRRLA